MDNIRNRIIDCLDRVGIMIDCNEKDVNINDYGVDSISFISFIVDVENEFGIEIPDGYLYAEIMQSLNGFINLVVQLIYEKNASLERNNKNYYTVIGKEVNMDEEDIEKAPKLSDADTSQSSFI